MSIIAFDKLKNSLDSGCVFTHTNIENARVKLRKRLAQHPEKIAIGVIGDDAICQPRLVSRTLITVLNSIGKKEDVEFIVGNDNNCSTIVDTFATKCNIESYVIEARSEPAWNEESTPYCEMVDKIISMSDIVVILVSSLKRNNNIDYCCNEAVREGCFVTKRAIKGAKR